MPRPRSQSREPNVACRSDTWVPPRTPEPAGPSGGSSEDRNRPALRAACVQARIEDTARP
jgi:hypothetical protein